MPDIIGVLFCIIAAYFLGMYTKRIRSRTLERQCIRDLKKVRHWFDRYTVDVPKTYTGTDEAHEILNNIIKMLHDPDLELKLRENSVKASNFSASGNIQITNSDGNIQIANVKSGGSIQIQSGSSNNTQIIN